MSASFLTHVVGLHLMTWPLFLRDLDGVLGDILAKGFSGHGADYEATVRQIDQYTHLMRQHSAAYKADIEHILEMAARLPLSRPIQKLPTELLTMVFCHALGSFPTQPQLNRLRLVCRHWNMAAKLDPHL